MSSDCLFCCKSLDVFGKYCGVAKNCFHHTCFRYAKFNFDDSDFSEFFSISRQWLAKSGTSTVCVVKNCSIDFFMTVEQFDKYHKQVKEKVERMREVAVEIVMKKNRELVELSRQLLEAKCTVDKVRSRVRDTKMNMNKIESELRQLPKSGSVSKSAGASKYCAVNGADKVCVRWPPLSTFSSKFYQSLHRYTNQLCLKLFNR